MRKKTFAHLLSKHIEDAGLKQTYVAATASISYNYLQRLLAGDRNPSEQVVQKLVETLHLTAEQGGELFISAGYAPPVALLQTSSASKKSLLPTVASEPDQMTQMAQRLYHLSQEVPEQLQPSFFEEIQHLLNYARYKYVLSGGENLLELERHIQTQMTLVSKDVEQEHSFSLDVIAQLVGELYFESSEQAKPEETEAASSSSEVIEDMLSAIDQLTGNLLSGEVSAGHYQPQIIMQILDLLRQGAPWEIRRRIAEALPELCKLDVSGCEHLMEALRLDSDKTREVDIRRRVIEALLSLVEASPQSLPVALNLLRPKSNDDKYVALASIEACGDIQTWIKCMLENNSLPSVSIEGDGAQALKALLQRGRTDLATIQRQLLTQWEGRERECLQFSLALHNLLCAPDALLLSLREGLQASDTLLQWVAARYLERTLPIRSVETLEIYKTLLEASTQRNIRRTVAKALPSLLHCLKEASLPVRVLARAIISDLAVDGDIYIRRAVADHAMRIFLIDREFLLILLRQMHKDSDRAIRHRLRPVALCLAQVWLTWYAETAGLVDTKRRPQTTVPFGDSDANN